jgi:NTP pyrophosphatase (non-canonical NTP hydrolase)
VDGVTSGASKNTEELIKQIRKIESQGVNFARLDTAFNGLASESGESADIIKKLKYHGKDYTPEIREHLIKELGDVAWYWAQACIALEIDPEDVLLRNVTKLEARYPGGKFSIEKSENRKVGDI